MPLSTKLFTLFKSLRERSNLLQEHYQILVKSFGIKKLKSFLLHESIIFSTITSKDGKKFHFEMTIFRSHLHEGGLTICLTNENRKILSSLTFNFGKYKNHKPFITIGGLHGSSLGKDAIISATRNLSGLRPKHTLLTCCYNFASS